LKGVLVASLVVAILLAATAIIVITPAHGRILVVGTWIPYPPFEYNTTTAGVISPGGFDIDLIRYIAQQSGYQGITVKEMNLDQLVTAVDSGQIDVIASGMPVNYTTDPNIAYSIPYWEASESLVVRSQSSFLPSGQGDLAGRNIAAIDLISQRRLVKTEWYTDVGITNNVTTCTKDNNSCVYRYTSLTVALADLQKGRLDGVVIDTPVARSLVSLFPVRFAFRLYEGEQYAFAVSKDNVQLLDSVNRVLTSYMGTPAWDNLVFTNFRS